MKSPRFPNSALAARCSWVLALLAMATMVPRLDAAVGDPPFHPSVGERFVPTDVDWEHPAYQASFDDPAELKKWRLEGASA